MLPWKAQLFNKFQGNECTQLKLIIKLNDRSKKSENCNNGNERY